MMRIHQQRGRVLQALILKLQIDRNLNGMEVPDWVRPAVKQCLAAGMQDKAIEHLQAQLDIYSSLRKHMTKEEAKALLLKGEIGDGHSKEQTGEVGAQSLGTKLDDEGRGPGGNSHVLGTVQGTMPARGGKGRGANRRPRHIPRGKIK